MREAVKVWGWLVILAGVVSLGLYLNHDLGKLSGADSPEDRKRVTPALVSHVGLCAMTITLGWLCRPISRRHRFAMTSSFALGVVAMWGLVAASNIRKTTGPFHEPGLAAQSDLMFLLAFFAVPVALVVAAGFAVLVDPRE